MWTCQTLIEREKDHRHSKLKITDTVLIELKLFRLYALNRAELTVRNNKCHMRNQSTLSSVWGTNRNSSLWGNCALNACVAVGNYGIKGIRQDLVTKNQENM